MMAPARPRPHARVPPALDWCHTPTIDASVRHADDLLPGDCTLAAPHVRRITRRSTGTSKTSARAWPPRARPRIAAARSPRLPTFATIRSTASFGTRTFVRLPHHVKKIVYNTARRTFQLRIARRPRSLVCPFVLGLVVHNQPRRGPGKVEAVRLVAVRTVHLFGGRAFDGRERERDGTSVSRAPANFRRGQRRALLKLVHSLVMQLTPSPFFVSVPSRAQEADTAPPMSSCSSGCKSQSRSRSCE